MSPEGIAASLSDGMTIGIGGWGSRRKPMALVRAICRSPVRDLTVVSCGGPDVGLLCAYGKVRHVVAPFVTLDTMPLDPWFRTARQRGDIGFTEYDEGMFMFGLLAAAHGLPFLPTPAGMASDVLRVNPGLRTIRSPYPTSASRPGPISAQEEEQDTGEELVAMPPLRLDAALVHMNRADARGNGQYLGPDPYLDDLFAKAARHCYLSCERLVEAFEGPVQSLLISRMMVAGVAETPNGGHFTTCEPDYGRDEPFQRRYAAAASDPAEWRRFRSRYLDVDEGSYQREVSQR
ncbi:acyl CoA--acetate/3-ketoacid CoA transferase subunit alpha [Nocardiopsis gilva YIM 90087]|uniref:Acyl CoA--acetate/3-ketoacid CoA transferase subunit alpha n=2 Tax=Nocardiopsis gilva TaxID=280236 RepID=A0A223SDF9_9ACTN|nr:CoA-transferase [Nocardiopsis gilva]ASU86160.1 acyl CoA--acetate/3-ketoacid CoA transferase subunit alpha [Nocardiopsis gilva YIM 90087]